MFGSHLLDPTSLLVLSNLLDATASNNLNASRLIRVKFCYHATCLMLLYPTTMVVGSNMLNFASSGKGHLPHVCIKKHYFPSTKSEMERA